MSSETLDEYFQAVYPQLSRQSAILPAQILLALNMMVSSDRFA